MLREALSERLVEGEPNARMIPRGYYSIRVAVYHAKRMIGLDPQIQTCHRFRKYFENALDDANVDHEKKMIIEGHFAAPVLNITQIVTLSSYEMSTEIRTLSSKWDQLLTLQRNSRKPGGRTDYFKSRPKWARQES